MLQMVMFMPIIVPLIGRSTNAIGVTQWNNGDYSDANNPEDDMNIFISAPNNLQYRDDEQGATFQTASELNYGNGKFKNNEGIIEKMTDVDAWKFKTDGGDVSILIESNPGITVLEVDAEMFNVDTEESFSFSQIKNLSAEFVGNIPAGNYLLLVRSGIHFTSQNEGPTNYGSVGRYEISGTAPNVKKTDNITNDFSFKIISPTSQNVTLTTVLDTNWIPFTIQTIDADKNHQIELMIDGEWKKMTAKSTNEWEYLAPAYLTQKSDIYVKMINKGQIKDSIFSINIFQPNVYPISYKQLKVVGFSSEMPDDNPYKIAGGEAAWIADGDTTTTWANALETNGWAPFPHWIEIELDSVYDLSALRIVGAENIRTFIPDSMTLYLDKDGSGTWSDSISATLNFQGELDLIFPIKEKRLAKKIKLEIYRTFGETEICSIAEIIPFKRKNNPILELNQNEFVENRLYPLQNPTTNGTNLTMVLETNEVSHADVRIVNTLGEVVYTDEFITTKTNEINWTPINKGLYIIQVIVEGKTLENLSTKVIVE